MTYLPVFEFGHNEGLSPLCADERWAQRLFFVALKPMRATLLSAKKPLNG